MTRLLEILAALLTAPVIEHPAYLSLAPGFQRTWGNIYDALYAGTMSLPRLEDLAAAQPLETSTTWDAVDESRWSRCDAETSPERGRRCPVRSPCLRVDRSPCQSSGHFCKKDVDSS